MTRTLVAAALALLAAPAFGQAPPPLFQRALQAPTSGQLYAYDFIDQIHGGHPAVTRGRVDPSRPKGDRVTVIEATGDKVDLKKLDERYEKNADGDIWCDNIINGYEGEVADRGSSADGRLFAFAPKPKPDARSDEKKLYKQLAAEVAIDEVSATIRTFTARLTKPWKPMILAKLNTVEMKGACEIAPNGRPFTARMNMTLKGSAMGADFSESMTQTITNLAPTG